MQEKQNETAHLADTTPCPRYQLHQKGIDNTCQVCFFESSATTLLDSTEMGVYRQIL